jgi:hypothetical protein
LSARFAHLVRVGPMATVTDGIGVETVVPVKEGGLGGRFVFHGGAC